VVALLAGSGHDELSAAWAVLHGARGLVDIDADAAQLGVAVRAAVCETAPTDARPNPPDAGWFGNSRPRP
jgi:hypothetical protein